MRTISNSQSPPPTTTPVRSPWHSPVPYLFGGLAAMLGLIAFALLILACSYWRLSSRANNERSEGQGDIESGNDKEGNNVDEKENKVYEEKILVIMAGDQKPSFIATPVICSCNKASSTPDHNIDNNEEEGINLESGNEKVKGNTNNVESIENTQIRTQQEQQQN